MHFDDSDVIIESETPFSELSGQSYSSQSTSTPFVGTGLNLISNTTKFKRIIFLLSEIGEEGTTTYVYELIKNGDGRELLELITEISLDGRTPNEEKILSALADCALYPKEAFYDETVTIQKAAYKKIVLICNTPSKLFLFLRILADRSQKELGRTQPQEVDEDTDTLKSKKSKTKKAKSTLKMGRMARNGIGAFYTDPNKSAMRLLYLLTKYKNRHGWTHIQILSKTHPKIPDSDREKKVKDIILKYVTRGYGAVRKDVEVKDSDAVDQSTRNVFNAIQLLHRTQKLNPTMDGDVEELVNQLSVDEHDSHGGSSDQVAAFPTDNFQLLREHLPTGFLSKRVVRNTTNFCY